MSKMLQTLVCCYFLLQCLCSFASNLSECRFKVKVLKKTNKEIHLEYIESLSENPSCRINEKNSAMKIENLKSSPDLFVVGRELELKLWKYSAMGVNGAVNAVEYTVIK